MIQQKYVCDRCGAQADFQSFEQAKALGWKRVIVTEPTSSAKLANDQNYELCHACISTMMVRPAPVATGTIVLVETPEGWQASRDGELGVASKTAVEALEDLIGYESAGAEEDEESDVLE